MILPRASILKSGTVFCIKRVQNLTEEQGDTLLVGRRQMTSSGGKVLYHVGVSARNASAGFSGHYQCIVERQYDRLFAVSTVGVAGRKSPLPQIPQIELKFCHQNRYNRFDCYLSRRISNAICC